MMFCSLLLSACTANQSPERAFFSVGVGPNDINVTLVAAIAKATKAIACFKINFFIFFDFYVGANNHSPLLIFYPCLSILCTLPEQVLLGNPKSLLADTPCTL